MTASTMLKNTTLRSDEFTCPSCVAKIENKLNGLDGVENAEVKFSSDASWSPTTHRRSPYVTWSPR